MPILNERAVLFHGLKVTWPRLLAVSATHLALVEGRNQLVLLSLGAGQALKIVALQTVPFGPQQIRFLDDGRHILLLSSRGNYAAVWSTEKARLVLELAGPDHLAATITRIGDQEVIAVCRHPGLLEAWSLPDAKPLLAAKISDTPPLIVAQMVHSGEHWRFVGHRYLEIDDTLLTLSHSALLAANGDKAAQGPTWSAPRIRLDDTALGDNYLIIQDDEGQSAQLQHLVGDVMQPQVPLPVRGLVTQTFGTHQTQALVCDDRLELWQRSPLVKELSMGVRAVAYSPEIALAAVVTSAGKVRLLTLQ